VLLLGLPDRFIEQGDPGIQLADAGLTKEGILKSIGERVAAASRVAGVK
jgi:1-deoxy-D-xylulose-5-phosphate synthase